jgi:ATP-dependent Clp protease ATP-binding subunit ClpC
MRHLNFTILLWSDPSGGWHGQWVEDEPRGLASGPTPENVLQQLDAYLRKLTQIQPDITPDLLATDLFHVNVELHPEYQVGKRTVTDTKTVTLRIPCVRGKDATGLWVTYIPTLRINFTFREAAAFKNLVNHYVRDRLSGQTPLELARHMAPPQAQIERITLRLPEEDWRSKNRQQEQPRFVGILDPLPGPRGAGNPSRCWERETYSQDLANRLESQRANVLIVSPPGAGKTSLFIDALKHLQLKHGKNSDKTRYYATNASRLISGMKYLGQWEERCQAIIAYLQKQQAGLVVENLLDLLTAGDNNPAASIAAFFAPFIERAELHIVAEATPNELDACRRLLPGFADLFNILTLPELTRDQSIRILQRTAQSTGRNLKVDPAPALAQTVYRLFSRFEPYRSFPGPATHFIDTLLKQAQKDRQPTVTAADALQHFTRRTGLPDSLLRDDIPLTRQDVLAPLLARVIGQDQACKSIADVMLTFKAGLSDPARPLGVFLFCGPTGVGKTELAKALAHSLFEHGQDASSLSSLSRLIRVDMSEFAGPDAPDRLLGTPAAGPGELVKRIRAQPFSVVLLDEIEKADPRIFDVLLRVFDEGRLTDALGRDTHFNSSVIIMTSNLGAAPAASFGFGTPPATDFDQHAMAFFRPEFVNRIDQIIPFLPLDKPAITRVIEKELAQLADREGLLHRRLTLSWSPAVIDLLMAQGFDARYGARPLQRAMESLIVTPLSAFLLAHPNLQNTTLSLNTSQNNTLVITN